MAFRDPEYLVSISLATVWLALWLPIAQIVRNRGFSSWLVILAVIVAMVPAAWVVARCFSNYLKNRE
jgi:hypothetical protein